MKRRDKHCQVYEKLTKAEIKPNYHASKVEIHIILANYLDIKQQNAIVLQQTKLPTKNNQTKT